MGNNSSEIRRLDQLGRVVLPKPIRQALEIGEGDAVSITLDGKKVVLEVYTGSCVFCGSKEDLFEFKGHTVCKTCKEELKLK